MALSDRPSGQSRVGFAALRPQRLMDMTNILLVGGGAREHAMAKKLLPQYSIHTRKLYVFAQNMNPGIARIAEEFVVGDITDCNAIKKYATRIDADIAIIGPEAALEAGVTDALISSGMAVAAPTKAAAEIETSKQYLRTLMDEYKIPGIIPYKVAKKIEDAASFVKEHGFENVVVKPDGLTGGKGVKIGGEQLLTEEQAMQYMKQLLHQDGKVILEQKLVGEEVSLQAFSDGRKIIPMPLVQDHKRAYEGDFGNNTGGMGSYSDKDHLLPFVSPTDNANMTRILQWTVNALRKDGREYRGPIYGQFMLTRNAPKLIEINARLGDPEAINTLTLLATDFLSICQGMAHGNLSKSKIAFGKSATVCKYVVPENYGEKTGVKACSIVEADESAIEGVGAELYWASVNEQDGQISTTQGRTAAIAAKAPTLELANEHCERALKHIHGEGLRARHDIGTLELIAKRIAHMKEIRKAL